MQWVLSTRVEIESSGELSLTEQSVKEKWLESQSVSRLWSDVEKSGLDAERVRSY